MTEPITCPRCGASLPANAPGGICPKCLLQAGLASEPSSLAASLDRTRTAFHPPKSEDLARRFPQLEIHELLGQGGMGAVFKARQPSLDRMVAVKILPPEVAGNPAFAERFAREARALARLSHQNIVSVFDFGRTEGQYYLVMEYIDGSTLRRLIETGGVKPEASLAIVGQICDALQFAHNEGVVHRDIKPENILIDKKGRVKIADFGLAKLFERDDETAPGEAPRNLTGTHQVMGTVRYMAPEQMEGSRAVDHRADIYSLGVVFYELLTGELPLGRFAPPSQRAPIDARLDDVVLRSLEKEPQRRYQQASEVKTAVECISQPFRSARTNDAPTVLSDDPPTRRTWWFEQSPAARRMMRGALAVGAILCMVVWLSTEFKGGIRAAEGNAHEQWTSIRTGFGDPWFSYASGEGGHVDLLSWSFACGLIGILLLGVWWRVRGAERRPTSEKPSANLRAASHRRPWLVWPIAVLNLLLSVALLAVYAGEDPIPFPETTPWIWRAWNTAEQVLGFAMSAGLFAASIGLLMWKWWARRMIVRLCVVGLALVVIGMPYQMRALQPHLVEDANAVFAADGLTFDDLPIGAEAMFLLIMGACLLIALPWLIGQLVYFTRPGVVEAFEAGAPPRGAFADRLFTIAGGAAGVLGFFAPLLFLMGLAAYFDQSSPSPTVDAKPVERVLHAFKPGVDRHDPSVDVVDGAWRFENTKNIGNFKTDLFVWTGEVPDSGVIVCRAKVKVEVGDRLTWGDIKIGPDFIERDIVEGRFKTEQGFDEKDSEWREVELRAPVEPFLRTDPPVVPIRIGVYAAGAIWVKDLELRHIPATDDDRPRPRPGETSLRKFTFRDRPIHRDYVLADGWRFTADNDRSVRLFELADPAVENCRLVFRARLRTKAATGAHLRMTARTSEGDDIDSDARPVDIAEGDTEWAWYETTLVVPAGSRPTALRLVLEMSGKKSPEDSAENQVWIKNVELLKMPLK